MANDRLSEKMRIITQELHGLEALVADPRIPLKDKRDAIKSYELILSREAGITLRSLQEIENVVHRNGLTHKQRIKELQALEEVFIGGVKKSLTEAGAVFKEKEWRGMFRRYVNQHLRIKMQLRIRKGWEKVRALARKARKKKGPRQPRKPKPR